jgi:hypothetical protein
MKRACRRLGISAGLVLGLAVTASAQTASSGGQSDGWKVTVYPILAWVPTHIGIETNVTLPGSGGGPGISTGGEAVDTSLDGAYLAGFSATNHTWRIDADGLWASVGGDRPERPNMSVDADAIYGRAMVGWSVYKDVYLTGGVRRMAIKYDVAIAGIERFTSKPGVWDPLVGIGWHREGRKVEWHGVFEGGGFGAGSDYDIGALLRADWKPIPHFGLTAGYNYLTFKVSKDFERRTLTATQTLHGPVVGFGLYF